MKKTLVVLVLSLGLALGTVRSASPQATLPQGSTDRPCDQLAGSAESSDSVGYAVMATITGVDRQRGILELETQEGRITLATALTDAQSLQEGDQLLVCFEGDAIGGEERLALGIH